MAKGRGSRGPTRMDLRRQAEAAESQEEEKEEEAAEEEPEDSDEGDDEEGGKKKKKKPAPKKKAPAVKKPPSKRVRAQKEVRHRAFWVVFDNSSKRVGTFEYSKKAEAEAL